MEEIPFIELEISLINSHTELSPEDWIRIYAERFRQIVDEHPDYTEFQVKHALYLMPHIENRVDRIL